MVDRLDRIVFGFGFDPVFDFGDFEWCFWTRNLDRFCLCCFARIEKVLLLGGGHWTVNAARGGGVHPMAMTVKESQALTREEEEDEMVLVLQCCPFVGAVKLEMPLLFYSVCPFREMKWMDGVVMTII